MLLCLILSTYLKTIIKPLSRVVLDFEFWVLSFELAVQHSKPETQNLNIQRGSYFKIYVFFLIK